jgi:DegV family protein with EDD domain
MLETSPDHPSTSQPNPENFTAAYKNFCDNTEGIVSIHISSRISGTYNSANTARKTLESRCPIEVIDSKFNSAGLGLVVQAAARIAQSGAGLSEVVDEAYNAISQVRMYGMFETMKYLARSGRVSKTIATASRILNVMPLLTFHDGDIVRAGLVRTINKGMERILDFVRNNIPASELTIVHSAVEDQAHRLKQRLGEYIPGDRISIAELGAGLGVHGGPGVLLVALRKSGEKNK